MAGFLELPRSWQAEDSLSFGCTVRGHSEHLFGDMVDTYN